jgi:hypothetical protein
MCFLFLQNAVICKKTTIISLLFAPIHAKQKHHIWRKISVELFIATHVHIFDPF